MVTSRHLGVKRVVSGGQTGADRGGLDVAIALGIEHGGWCPKGRRAEDGRIPDCYHLEERETGDYAARTRWNVIDSDATIAFTGCGVGGMGKGSAYTMWVANRESKPFVWVDVSDLIRGQRIMFVDDFGFTGACVKVRRFLDANRPSTINIAGSRESTCPGMQRVVREILYCVLTGKKGWTNGKGATNGGR